jgi:hypothetical protein
MAFFSIQIPPDGSGKQTAARKIAGGGPAGADLYFPAGVSQQDNGVGQQLHTQQWAPVPTSTPPTVLSAVACAIDVLWFNNWTASPATLYVDDGAGNTIWEYTLQAGEFFPLILNGMPAAGLRWQCTAGSLNGAARWFTAS